MTKVCEVCEKKIPEDYGNLLCDEHYDSEVKDIERIKEQDKEPEKVDHGREVMEQYKEGRNDGSIVMKEGGGGDPHSQAKDASITEEGYMENPEAPDKPQVLTNMLQFLKSGHLLYPPTKSMYNFIKNCAIEKAQKHAQFSKHIWKPHMVDVGCGSGTGTNIISQEADFAWGIDKNALSVKFAQEAYTRDKNGIYYTPQVKFDEVDIMDTELEGLVKMEFDFVVAIEIIEHVNDYRTFLNQIIKLFGRKEKSGAHKVTKEGDYYQGTEWFISTPNRNHPKLSNEGPKNVFHVREWTSKEMCDILSEYFEEFELYSYLGDLIPKEEHETTTHSPIIAKCRKPRI